MQLHSDDASHKPYHALLIGHSEELLRAFPTLLDRAGFVVDVLTSASRFEQNYRSYRNNSRSRNNHGKVRQVIQVSLPEDLVTASLHLDLNQYDLVVIGDDKTLREIMAADVSAAMKLRLLPVYSEHGFRHIGSKIGLSEVLQDAGIPTPRFTVVRDEGELDALVKNLTEPVMLKIDQSGGGSGVFLLDTGRSGSGQSDADQPGPLEVIEMLKGRQLVYPLLAQQRIQGDVLDLSSFYQHGELICTSYSVFEAVVRCSYGPSSVRQYSQLSTVNENVFELLRDLGRALSAHGFVNLTCMRESATGKLYVFEADMRASVWVDYGKYLGDDHAVAIRRYFDTGATLVSPVSHNPAFPEQVRIPFVYRLTPWEILTNAHQVWRYCQNQSVTRIAQYCMDFLWSAIKGHMTMFAVLHVKPWLKPAHWERLRSMRRSIRDWRSRTPRARFHR
ncbi:hypothetical protein DBV39_03990 [Orrella marina]|uniref:ATP-grasp domain-containing protein n=2 Tax=Orrella marina TaxID=2163011 RepID=A0A2R4XGR4_9BURK|nr:hypothetical protein DBV39_03990 [Orrella marina]